MPYQSNGPKAQPPIACFELESAAQVFLWFNAVRAAKMTKRNRRRVG